MATNPEIKMVIKTTWVKPVSIFICKYIKKKWALRLISKWPIAYIYANGKLVSRVMPVVGDEWGVVLEKD